jgi:hypothetical protein
MNHWKNDKRWSDKFLPEIKSILGQQLITEPPIEEDEKHNTDLIVLRLDAIRIGCRIRKFQYIRNYGNQFTIRQSRPNGAKTELTKIIEGWGDYFFYGFCDEQENRICRWMLGDYKPFRIWFMRQVYNGKIPGHTKENFDGSSAFIAFNVCDIPGFVIASNWVN